MLCLIYIEQGHNISLSCLSQRCCVVMFEKCFVSGKLRIDYNRPLNRKERNTQTKAHTITKDYKSQTWQNIVIIY